MDRRAFTAGLAASGIARGTGLQARERKEGRDGLPATAHVFLRSIGRLSPGIPSHFIVVSDTFAHQIGADLRFPLSNENRSGLLNPTLKREFRSRVQIGDVRVGGRVVWIVARVQVGPSVLRLTDFDISFRINGERLARPYTGRVPQLSRLRQIGGLFRRKSDTGLRRDLLVQIRPEILEYAE